MQRLLFLALTLALAAPAVGAESQKNTLKDDTGLSADFVYKYLVGEIAGQRGEIGLASTILLDLAESSRDVSLAERATRAALYGNQPQVALKAASLWAELDPASREARQVVAQLLLASGKISELRPHLQQLIAGEDDKTGAFLYLAGTLSHTEDKTGVLKLVQELAKPYPELAAAHFAVAHAAWGAGKDNLALDELKLVDQKKPGWEQAALLKGQVLLNKAPSDTLQFYREFLGTYPLSNEVRLAYAKLLINERQLESARQQFTKLIEVAPNNPEMQVVVGLLCVQLEDFAQAESHFRKGLELGFKEPDQLYLYLGQTAERQKNMQSAQDWYSKVAVGSPQHLDAQLQLATLLANQDRLQQALKLLHDLPDLTQEQRIVAIQTEASLLNQAKRSQEAFDLLRNAVESLPNSPDLIYDYAMTAERIQQFDIMERELRQLILLKPEQAHPYNALGYSLADRNERLDEAKKLIEKALSLSPNDYFILDSMGWVQYRRGQIDQALDYLKRAYAVQSDPEIAAHLGEVLWKKGQHEEALKTLESALHNHPDNELLLETSKKLQQ